MFVTDCQACGLRELRGARSIELLVDTGHGVDLVYRCARCAAANMLALSGEGQPAASAA